MGMEDDGQNDVPYAICPLPSGGEWILHKAMRKTKKSQSQQGERHRENVPVCRGCVGGVPQTESMRLLHAGKLSSSRTSYLKCKDKSPAIT